MITVVEIKEELHVSDQIKLARLIVALISLLGLRQVVRNMLN